MGSVGKQWRDDEDGARLTSLPAGGSVGFLPIFQEDATEADRELEPWSAVRIEHPGLRISSLVSGGEVAGRVAASNCAHGEDEEPAGAPSMCFVMGQGLPGEGGRTRKAG